jgi:IS1 family transposase
METEGTLLYGSQTAVETICRALASLAEGMAVRGVGRVFEVDPNTVLDWLAQAASHIEAVSHFLLHDLQVSQVQMDELYALLSQIDQGELSPQEAARRLRRPHRWVWGAIDPVSKVMLATVVGDRSLATAQRLVHAVVRVLAPGVAPVFVTDGLAHYATALLTHFGDWVSLPRQGSRGPHPKPRWLPLPQLHYAQVVKRRVKSRVVEVTTRIVYGTVEVIQQTLAQQGWQINTAFIERLNRTIRHQVPALGRRVVSLAKTSQGLSQQLSLWRGYYNFCLPHTSLRLALPEPRPTRGQGSPKKWRPRTPAMAAKVTSHLWTMKDLLLFRVPPWPQAVAA